jgi:hypothetical protein
LTLPSILFSVQESSLIHNWRRLVWSTRRRVVFRNLIRPNFRKTEKVTPQRETRQPRQTPTPKNTVQYTFSPHPQHYAAINKKPDFISDQLLVTRFALSIPVPAGRGWVIGLSTSKIQRPGMQDRRAWSPKSCPLGFQARLLQEGTFILKVY